jgi:ubiquinone/menaquinone biosynthesis C-methylase UbiE
MPDQKGGVEIMEYDTNSMKGVSNPVRATAFKEDLAKEALSLMRLEDDLQILELGCGNGWFSYKLAAFLGGKGNIVGVDINENAIKQAKQGLPRFKYDNLEFHVNDVTELPYRERFDYAVSINAFHHFTDRQTTLKNINKGLRSGGELIVIDFNGDSAFMRFLDTLSVDHKGPIRFLTSKEFSDAFYSADFREMYVIRKRLFGVFSIMIGHAKKKDD